jgi:RHS repeat-associated protein
MGNFTNISGPSGMTGCNTESLNNPVGTNNQVTTFCYDSAGNVLDTVACSQEQSGHTYVYDAEGHLQSPPAVGAGNSQFAYTYFYDGDGNRVQKCDANPCTSGTTTGLLYWLGVGGEVLDESSRTGTMQEEYVYFDGQRIARRDVATNDAHYYFSNHLGSSSVITDSSGNVQEQTDFFPYGGIAYTIGGDENRYKFTGKERDSESSLDNFGARYFASTMGRFLSPDPISGTLANPQSLNRYVYVFNNPLTLTDPTGMIVDWEDSTRSKKDQKTNAQRAFEKRLSQLKNSKRKSDQAKGAALQQTYDRLQASKATFEVVQGDSSGSSRGDIEYNGHDHFTINLKGSSDYTGLSDLQKVAHEFEHGRQVLDGELSYKFNPGTGNWDPFAHDVTDEANGFAAGFAIEGATPGQGAIINGAATALTNGGLSGEASYLHGHIANYRGLLELPLNVPNPPPPGVYEVPK